jgi:hypothetical protein
MTAEPLSLLPEDKRAAVAAIVAQLAALPGVKAVVLGGSYARGVAGPRSDVDLGLYYAKGDPFRIDDVRRVAESAATRAPVVTDFYEWGPWVNGGAWLDTAAGRVDFLYREIEHVERVIAAAGRGEIEWHFAQQPPFGFRSVIYLAETAVCLPLHDPGGSVARLKASVATYPEALRTAIVRSSLWSAEFTVANGEKMAAAGDVYSAAGCATRALCELTQVLFALNRVYFIADKGALEAIESMPLRPTGYAADARAVLAAVATDPVAAMARLGTVVRRIVELAGDLYAARFELSALEHR